MRKNREIRSYITEQSQMSESLIVSFFLAFSGGFQDAYTYISRGSVFANAQTGNIVLMSTSFLQGNLFGGLRYLYPISAFVLGVFISHIIYKRFNKLRVIHWRQIILIAEILILFSVGFLPEKLNSLANVLVSFSCAMQVQAFRTVGGGITYASTMCVGNLRGGTAALAEAIMDKDRAKLRTSLYYFAVIFVFALGAGTGAVLSMKTNLNIIWICCILLAIASLLMDLDRKAFRKNEKKK